MDHTADILFQAEASTLGELFEQCGLAVEEAQIELSNVCSDQKVSITGKNKSVEHLLFDFLDDLLFYKDSEQLIFSKFECNVEEKEGQFTLSCEAFGEKLSEKHEQKVDVKAITMHMFEVKKESKDEDGKNIDFWKAQVLIDI